jgi:arylsulfatase A-like enzyme
MGAHISGLEARRSRLPGMNDTSPQTASDWAIAHLTGLGIALAAGLAQLWLLRFGALSGSQLLLFWICFGALGLALSLMGWSGAWLLFRRRVPAHAAAALLPLIAFLILVPLNLRPLPDVYLLVTDATRADHLSLYGYERSTTPYLEELARESAVFTNMISQGTHTIVSTPSLLASCYPSEHGVTSYAHVLSGRFTLLSEYLKDLGYQSFAFSTNPHLGPTQGYAQGFDSFGHSRAWARIPAAEVNERFLGWLASRGEAPVFAFLFYIDPHNPYLPPAPYQKLFDPDWKGRPVSDWDQKRPRPEPRVLVNLVAQYDGTIAYWDSELRSLTTALDEMGRWENSILVYTSDHGEAFWEHGFWGHNKTPYESLIHVPLVVSLPVPIRFPPLRRTRVVIDEVVSSVDVLPSVLDFLGAETNDQLRGRSVLPLVFGGEEGPERVAYVEEILTQYGPYDIRAIRSQTEKYVRVLDFEGEREPGDLFFDLLADPEEKVNLVSRESDRAAQLRGRLEAMIAEASRHAQGAAGTVTVDEATVEALEALGYLDE